VEHGSDYYTVGYVPAADKLDGNYHRIQVKLDGPALSWLTGMGTMRTRPAKNPGATPALRA